MVMKGLLIVCASLAMLVSGGITDEDFKRMLEPKEAVITGNDIQNEEKKWIFPAIAAGRWIWCKIKKCKRDFNEEVSIEDLKRALAEKDADEDNNNNGELTNAQKRWFWKAAPILWNAGKWAYDAIKKGKRENEEMSLEDLKRALGGTY